MVFGCFQRSRQFITITTESPYNLGILRRSIPKFQVIWSSINATHFYVNKIYLNVSSNWIRNDIYRKQQSTFKRLNIESNLYQFILHFQHSLFWEANDVKNCIFFLLCLFKRYIRLLKKGGKVRLRGAAKTLQQSKKMLTHSSFEHTNTDMIFDTQTLFVNT